MLVWWASQPWLSTLPVYTSSSDFDLLWDHSDITQVKVNVIFVFSCPMFILCYIQRQNRYFTKYCVNLVCYLMEIIRFWTWQKQAFSLRLVFETAVWLQTPLSFKPHLNRTLQSVCGVLWHSENTSCIPNTLCQHSSNCAVLDLQL